MVTYLLLNVVFVAVVMLVFRIKPAVPSKRGLLIVGALLALTAVFDSVLVVLKIVGYSDNRILGLAIGFAPLEDYFYPLLAAILIPALWARFGGGRDRDA